MTEQPAEPSFSEITSDDRLWALLSFLFTPIIPIVLLLLEDKKARPFIKYHLVPSLLLGVAEAIIAGVLGWIPVLGCFVPLLWIINLILGLKAFQGEKTNVPVISDFARQQGWI